MSTKGIEDLKTEYEKGRGKENKRLARIESVRKEFVQNFPVQNIHEMKIEEYVVGLPTNYGNRNSHSFCNWLENKTEECGVMHIRSSGDFYLFYSVDEKSYMVQDGRGIKKIVKDATIVLFEELKIKIERLLRTVKIGDNSAIQSAYEELPLQDHVKAKILYMYFPDMFLNVFSSHWIDWYLKSLGLQTENSSFEGRKSLMEFKKRDITISKWSTQQFAEFLYDSFTPPDIGTRKEMSKRKKELLDKKKDFEERLIGGVDNIENDKKMYEKIAEIDKQLEDLP